MNDKQEKGAMQVDVQLVRDLAALLDDTNLTEIEVEDGDRKIRVAAAAVGRGSVYRVAIQSASLWRLARRHRCTKVVAAAGARPFFRQPPAQRLACPNRTLHTALGSDRGRPPGDARR